MWKHLKHRNIVPFRGVTSPLLQLISVWMPGGDLRGYVKKYPDADRLGLVGVPPLGPIPRSLRHKLFDVAEGLHFLHSTNIVHGGLKGVLNFSKPRFTIDTCLAKYSCGCRGPCTDHGFSSRDGHSKLKFDMERTGLPGPYIRTMDCARDTERGGGI